MPSSDEIRTFIEDRLQALDPSISLESGSRAQTDFVEPVLTFLGTDPFETDIEAFIVDRFSQEFPDIYSGDPSVVSDVFAKPLQLMLEPFKRGVNILKLQQSLADPDLLTTDSTESLAANFFFERTAGSRATGTARVKFPVPKNDEFEVTTRFYSSGGLNFYPTAPLSISAEEMIFNRDGSLFYVDVPVQAEEEGDEYNIGVDELTGVDGVSGVAAVTNLKKFSSGAVRLDNAAFVDQTKEMLNERSLNTRRGARARLLQEFQNDTRAIQVIGAGDVEMQRDILVATSPGHSWITGSVSLYNNLALVQARIIDGEEDDAPAAEDTLFLYLNSTSYPSLDQDDRLVELTVESLVSGPLADAGTGFQQAYLVTWSGDFPTGVTQGTPAPGGWVNGQSFEGGFRKPGNVRVSSLPDIGAVSPALSVPNGETHVYGHTDVYVRPILQEDAYITLDTLSDSSPLVERSTLDTNGAGSPANRVVDSASFDFAGAGVEAGHLIIIDSGETDEGVYTIQEVTAAGAGAPYYLYLTEDLTVSQSGLRYKILSNIRIDPFDVTVSKFPFGSVLANDLSTQVGSNLLTLSTNDMLSYSVEVGDTIKLTSGNDKGEYTITAFDSVLGGRGLITDQVMGATASGITYEVFKPLDSLQNPLVRIKQILLLDSSGQSTGVSIPPAQPLGAKPTSDFTSAKIRKASTRRTGYVLPDIEDSYFTKWVEWSVLETAADASGTRYSAGIDSVSPVTTGSASTYQAVLFPDTGPTESEFDFHGNAVGGGEAQGKCSWFIAPAESTDETVNYPPIDEPKQGECLTIKNGPNAGSYLIKQVYKFKRLVATTDYEVWDYFIQIYGEFPVDVFKSLIDFINETGVKASLDISVPASASFDTVIEATYAGVPGNAISLATVADGTGAGSLTRSGTAFTFHYDSGVTLVSEFEDAVDALTGDDDLIAVRTVGTSPSYALASGSGDTFGTTLLTGGTSIVSELPLDASSSDIDWPGTFIGTGSSIFDQFGARLNTVLTSTYSITSPAAAAIQTIVAGLTQCSYEWGDPARGVLRTYFEEPTFFEMVTGGADGSTEFQYTNSSSEVIKFWPDPNRYTKYELIPGRLIGDVDPTDYRRDLDASSPTAPEFTDTDEPTMFQTGIKVGDVLSVHEEVVATGYGTPSYGLTGVQLLQGSNQLTAPSSAGSPFSAALVGTYVFIEEGVDKGGYVVTEYVDANNIKISHTATETTPTIVEQASEAASGTAKFGTSGSNIKVTRSSGTFAAGDVGRYITVYGVDYNDNGSWKIESLEDADATAVCTLVGTTKAWDNSVAFRWVTTAAPSSAPTNPSAGGGDTELVALRPVRFYEGTPQDFTITAVPDFDDLSTSSVTIGAGLSDGFMQPYRIYRTNIRRVTPSEMDVNQDDSLYFVDSEVLSLSPGVDANIIEDTYLTLKDDTFTTIGFSHNVTDPALTYSTKETGTLDLPIKLLPVGSEDKPGNYVDLPNSPIQIQYERSSLVSDFQDLLDSAQDRITSANFLARHFLPAYISYDATYNGGSVSSTVAKKIIEYIDTLPIETAIDVSEIQDIISKNSGDVDTPTKVISIIHDWSRVRWVELNENELGGTTTKVPYDGTARVSFYRPGPDVSDEDTIPAGERINLTRE